MDFIRRICTCIAVFATVTATFSQNFYDFGFSRSQNITVHHPDEQFFLFPWTGGINSVSCHEFDLNGDEHLDLVCFEKHGNRLLTFINNGIADSCSYTFAPAYTRQFPKLHDWVIFRDFDRDGRADIFTYGTAGISVYRNISDGNGINFELVNTQIQSLQFGSHTNLYASPDDYLAIEDIDGDGDLDILNFWLLGKYVHLHRNYSMEEYGDCDHLEFRLEDECWGHFEEGGEDNSILLNSSCGRKEEPTRHVGSTLMVKDLTGNGLPDLVLGDIDFPNLVYLQNGGTLEDALMVAQDTAFPNQQEPIRLFSMPVLNFVDVDNDGVEELLASPADPVLNKSKDINSVWLYRYDTQTSEYKKVTECFLQSQMIDVGSGATPLFYDWDNDGLMDLFIGNYGSYDTSAYINGFLTSTFSSSISYYKNVGSESEPEFQLITDDFGSLRQWGLLGLHPAFGDLDGNGTIDMLCGTTDGALVRFTNRSHDPQQPDFNEPDFNYIAHDFGDYAHPQLFDLDRDGHKDLLVGNRRGRIAYLRNVSSTQIADFQLITDTLGGVDVRDAQNSYFGFCTPVFFRNNNNETMLFCGNEQGKIFFYKQIDNNLNGTFRQEEPLFEMDGGWRGTISEGLRSAPAVADINNDGRLDLVVGNHAGGVSYFMGVTPPPVGIREHGELTNQLKADAFPNPATDRFSIRLSKAATGQLSIMDATGRVILSQNINNQHLIEIDCQNFRSGIYFGKICDSHFKIIIQ
ncbi:MAG: T9SS type A sorting domain-containing protein [Bacteroidales bacterium]|nr:T9SS type A sorting domain-containing protein [Bacteroidales bacterium]